MMNYHKKILPYLDGSLSIDEKAEFEAFVHTHPDFETLVRNKEQELTLLKNLIPVTYPNAEAISALESEVKSSIFHLLKEEPKNLWGTLKNRFEEWSNR